MSKNKKEPLQLKQEELEVGLERYRKDKNRPPGWAFEYGPWIVIGLVAALLLLPMIFMGGGGNDSQAPTSYAVLVPGMPMKVWAEGSTTQLRSVKVSVANSGVVAARGVVVTAIIRGREFNLPGVSVIESGRSEAFSGPVDTPFKQGDELVIKAICATCQGNS